MKKTLLMAIGLFSLNSFASGYGRTYCECSVEDVVKQAVAYCNFANQTHPCSITSIEKVEDENNTCANVTRSCDPKDVELYEVIFGGK